VGARPSPPALEQLAAEIQNSAWELALAAAEEGLLDDQIPSLQRLGRLGQLGDMPTFITELARELEEYGLLHAHRDGGDKRYPATDVEIAVACGFGSAAHFSRSYHAWTGKAPSGERRRVEAGITPALR
jgi:AraC-like DNA-binding protein